MTLALAALLPVAAACLQPNDISAVTVFIIDRKSLKGLVRRLLLRRGVLTEKRGRCDYREKGSSGRKLSGN